MTQALRSLADGIDAVVDLIGRVTAWSSFALVLVMATNVLLRYLFSTGSVWAQELEWHLMVPICLFGMAYALRHGEHVRVDVLFARYSPRAKAAVDLLAALVAIAVCALVIHYSLAYVGQSWRNSEGSANPGGIPWRWALKALIPVGFSLFLLQSVAEALRAGLRLRDGH
ncbi:MAG: TRAP transporter small permease subunit [Alphaproteobacteria bacterium]|nr:TRAP transporter small permease subunit [Alphaproteobacteria bacterium]